jgi:hypothetical protein
MFKRSLLPLLSYYSLMMKAVNSCETSVSVYSLYGVMQARAHTQVICLSFPFANNEEGGNILLSECGGDLARMSILVLQELWIL